MSFTDNEKFTVSMSSRLYYYSDNWQVLEENDTTAQTQSYSAFNNPYPFTGLSLR